MSRSLLLTLLACAPIATAEPMAWEQSYAAGQLDPAGNFAGGSEIMHLVAHKGALYAANGYWVDARWQIPPEGQRQSAQVLRLDEPGGRWHVDLQMGGEADVPQLEYMKGNILKSVTFTRDSDGRDLLEPVTLLVAASGSNVERGGAVSAWTRDDATGKWTHTLVRHGSGGRWVPRDMEVYRDKVTGAERLFMSLGNPGIISGAYDPDESGKIRWGRHLEFPFLEAGNFTTRPLGMAQANGSLFFSEGDSIYRRVDGEQPRFEEVLDLYQDTDTDVGGIRGLTAVPNPGGDGESLLFLWAPGGRSQGEVIRLDSDGRGGFTRHDEIVLADLMGSHVGAPISYLLAAHNMMYPVIDPLTGNTVHLIGMQGNLRGKDELKWRDDTALYGGAAYAIRRGPGEYTIAEVNNAFDRSKTPLVSPRAFCASPFGRGDLYVGGHDSSRRVSDNMAWVFKAPLAGALGDAPLTDAPPRPAPLPPPARWTEGPVFELRIYAAAERRHRDLIRRFREHTDRIFKRHGMEAIGYWLPAEGTPKAKRRIVYVLRHPSRYAAYTNWIAFNTDREWEKLIEQPEFAGLLSERPDSVFMTAADLPLGAATVEQTGGLYELRTYTAAPGKLAALQARLRGMRNIAHWNAFDAPESEDTLIYLLHHDSREAADESWREAEASILAEPPERLLLNALDFSPLK